MKNVALIFTATVFLLFPGFSWAQRQNLSQDSSELNRVNIENDFDTLGGNELLIKKAQALDQ
jgi:hypothetical protein